jgi:hypothetical protein
MRRFGTASVVLFCMDTAEVRIVTYWVKIGGGFEPKDTNT